MATKKTAAELRAEIRLLRQSHISLAVASVVTTLIRYGALCICVWFIYLSINSLAGKQTVTNVLVNLLGNFGINDALSYVLGGSGVIYGINQNRLRQKAIKHIQTRNIELEKQLDPKRSSSNLTKTGETNPEDED